MMRIKVGCLSLVVALLTATAAAAGDTMPLRSFSRFKLDSGTANGLWAEIGASFSEDSKNRVDAEAVTVLGRIAYGGEHAEAGVIIPYHNFKIDPYDSKSEDSDSIGDIELYGKVIPVRTELIDLGVGMSVSFQSGDKKTRLGDGETNFVPFFTGALHQQSRVGADKSSFLPFLTGAVHLGMVDFRGHFGYRFYADKGMWESFHYGFGLYAPIRDRIVARTEFNAFVQKAPGRDPDPWTFEPGVDIYLAVNEDTSVLLRPTGLVGMNGDAPDWGIGGSIVVNWSPPR
jgi:hypothetical protein